jgi:methylated-DNA-[protein]-cysteine S-methyltransferase
MTTDGEHFFVDHVDTPLGALSVVADRDGRLRASGWGDPTPRLQQQLGSHGFVLEAAEDPFGFSTAFASYFAGDLTALDPLPVHAEGTPFQRAVWGALRAIPCGETRSYGDIARRLGKPGAMRAVGMANHVNPVGVAVPCHRVIGANGSLTGYAGGLDKKRWLLAHEGSAPLLALPGSSSSR